MAFQIGKAIGRIGLTQSQRSILLNSQSNKQIFITAFRQSNRINANRYDLPTSSIASRILSQQQSIRNLSTSSSLHVEFGQNFKRSEEYEQEDYENPNQRAKQPPKWYQRPVIWILGLMPILTLFLGVWQIKRLKWKLDLIDELEMKLKREPLNLPKNIDLEMLLEHYTNRLFTVSGSFPNPIPESTIFLGPRVRDGQVGYHIIQPLQREVGGGDIVVDRGFVPKEKIINHQGDPSTWRLMDSAFASTTKKSTHLLLLPRKKERNSFTPVNDAKRHIWYFADVDEIRQYFSGDGNTNTSEEYEDTYTPGYGVTESVRSMLGLENNTKGQRDVLPIYMEEIFEGNVADASRSLKNGQPIGRAATVELRNQHAVYAATWFSLSAATSVMLAILLRRGPK